MISRPQLDTSKPYNGSLTIDNVFTPDSFLLEGNPIRAIRRTLLTQSTHDLKKYLRTRGPPLGSAAGTIGGDCESTADGKGREMVRRMREIEYAKPICFFFIF
jgi:hypothetical protein